jgi:hypothetical protein
MRHQGATVAELARVTELAGLPGETLTRLAARMERHELAPGERLDAEERVGIVLTGMLSGPAGVLRPGDQFEGSVSAAMPATVASCRRSDYEELVRPRSE